MDRRERNMPNVLDVDLSEFFHTKIKEVLKEKYPDEYSETLTKEEFEKLLLRLVHENDQNLIWDKTSAYGGALDEHLDFKTGLQLDQLRQKLDKILAGDLE